MTFVQSFEREFEGIIEVTFEVSSVVSFVVAAASLLADSQGATDCKNEGDDKTQVAEYYSLEELFGR